MKVLHVVGGPLSNGSFKGAEILHKALLEYNIDSKILSEKKFDEKFKNKEKIISINNNFKIECFIHYLFC